MVIYPDVCKRFPGCPLLLSCRIDTERLKWNLTAKIFARFYSSRNFRHTMSDRATIAKVFQLAEDDGSNSLALTERESLLWKTASDLADHLGTLPFFQPVESLCRIYSLSAQDLHIKWEAFSFSLRKGPLLTPTVDLIRQFRINLQRDFEQSLQQQQKQQRTTTRTVVTNTNTMMDFSEYTSAMDEDDILENL